MTAQRPGEPERVAGEGVLVAVVGAGTMGAGIAEVAARAGHRVQLVDGVDGVAGRAVDGIRERLARDVSRRRMTAAEADAIGHRVVAVTSIGDLAGARVVIEAVVEDLATKRRLLADLELLADDDAILATNTSSLSVTAIAAGLHHPGRVVGLHFFNPPPRMRLVEVVRGDATDETVVNRACELARSWGKTPVVCSSTPGFVVNRVARPFYGEAHRLVEEGVADPATVDAVLTGAGGFPVGPFALTDLVGQDVNLAVSRSVWEQTFHDPRYAPTVLQQRLVDAGRLGRKTGRGVFAYDGTRATDATPTPAAHRPAPATFTVRGHADELDPMTPFFDRVARAGVRRVLSDADSESGPPGVLLPGDAVLLVTDGSRAASFDGWAQDGVVLLDWAHNPATCTAVALAPSARCTEPALDSAIGLCQAAGVDVYVIGDSPGLVVARTVSMLVNEAVELVGRGEASATDVDVAMLLGTGYPSGPLEWGDRLEPWRIEAALEEMHRVHPTGRYRPSPRFEDVHYTGTALRDL